MKFAQATLLTTSKLDIAALVLSVSFHGLWCVRHVAQIAQISTEATAESSAIGREPKVSSM